MKKTLILKCIILLLILIMTGCMNIKVIHEHIICPECGKCIDPECDGTKEEKCQGHVKIHEHIECKICGKCIDPECDGTEEEKCQGCQNTQYHWICDICNKCNDPDCNWLEKYKGCTGHVKTVRNHFISFNDKIMDTFEENAYYEINSYDEYLEFIELYDMFELIVDSNKSKETYEYSKEFINNYDAEYFKNKSLLIFSFKGTYDFRDLCYVYDCQYYNGVLTVPIVSGFGEYYPMHKCSICSIIEIENEVIPLIDEMEYEYVSQS